MDSLIKYKNITHKLTVKTSDDSTKSFYIDEEKATKLLKNLNSSEQFIVLSETQEAFPKFGAELQRMTKEEIDLIRGESQRKANIELQRNEQLLQEQIRKEKSDKVDQQVDNWIENNKQEYEKMVLEEFNNNFKEMPITEKTRRNLAIGKVRSIIKEKIL